MAARRDLSFDRAIEQRFCLDMRDERFQRAGEEANVVRQFDPDLPDLLVLEGMQQRQAGHIVAARAAFSCAIKRNADLIGAHSGLASLQVIAGNYEQALPLVEYDLRRCPQHHEANLVKGEALLGLKRYAQALQPLRTAYQSAPMWPGTGILYATALEKTGDYQTALSAALKELSVQPDASEDRRVRQLVRSVSQNIEPGYVIKSIQSVQTGLQPGSWLDALRLRAEQRAANHGDDLAWQLKEFCRTLFR
jgi:tetratricopeptide (TPR) repeat protein